jgi:hypothetical protein
MVTKTLSGGYKLQEKLQSIAKGMTGSLSAGFFAGETYPDGTSVPEVAFYNEFGTSKSPARPFFRSAISNDSDEWGDVAGKAAVATNYDGIATLTVVGNQIVESITQSISGWQDPANAPSTVKSKGFNKPLIDTAQMLRAPTFKIDK